MSWVRYRTVLPLYGQEQCRQSERAFTIWQAFYSMETATQSREETMSAHSPSVSDN